MGVVVMTGWAVFIDVDAIVVPEEISGDLLDWLYGKIGCRIVESVPVPRDRFGRDDIIMMVDEEGLLRDDPQINIVASALYGHVIVGNAVLMRVGETEDGDLDWMGMTGKEAEQISIMTRREAVDRIWWYTPAALETKQNES